MDCTMSTMRNTTNDENENENDINEIILSSECKLCDFGLAVKLIHPDEEHYTLCGSPNYLAPEIIQQQAHSLPADLWSMGCLFRFVVTRMGKYTEEEWKSMCSNDLIDFMSNFKEKDPNNRLDIFQLSKHPFLNFWKNSKNNNNNNNSSSNNSNNQVNRKSTSYHQTNPIRHSLSFYTNTTNQSTLTPNTIATDLSSDINDKIKQDKFSDFYFTDETYKCSNQPSYPEFNHVNSIKADNNSSRYTDSNTTTETSHHQNHIFYPKLSEEPSISHSILENSGLKNDIGQYKTEKNMNISESSKSKYRQSIEYLRKSFNHTFTKSLSSYDCRQENQVINRCLPGPKSNVLDKFPSQSTSSSHLPLLSSQLEDLVSFLYISTNGELLVYTPNHRLIYIFQSNTTDLYTMLPDSTQSNNNSHSNYSKNPSKNRFYRIVVSKDQPIVIDISQLSDIETKEYCRLRSGCSIYDRREENDYDYDHIIQKPILTIVNGNALLNWNVFNLSITSSIDKSIRIDRLNSSSTIYAMYEKITILLPLLKTRIPKLILYLSLESAFLLDKNDMGTKINNNNDNNNSSSNIDCKCMLMSNSPLPHFCIQFKDTTSFRYELSTGKVRVDYVMNYGVDEKIQKSFRWEGNMSMGRYDEGNDSNCNSICNHNNNNIIEKSKSKMSDWMDVDGLPVVIKKYLIVAQLALKKCLYKEQILSNKSKPAYPIIEVDRIKY